MIVTITRWPERPDENPEGVIETVLGRPGDLSVEAAKILVLEGIEEGHSERAVEEAQAFGDVVPDAMKEGREDLPEHPPAHHRPRRTLAITTTRCGSSAPSEAVTRRGLRSRT